MEIDTKPMKKSIIIFSAVILGALPLKAQRTIFYSLPRTVLEMEVEVVKTTYKAGPYAIFAPKYLGIEAAVRDSAEFSVAGVGVNSFVEADPSQRFFCRSGNAAARTLLSLTSVGLVSGESDLSGQTERNFSVSGKVDFDYRPSNLTSKVSTLYDAGTGKAVSRKLTVEKSKEAKAAEAAERIFEIRDNRYRILVGDTDASYGGEAMKAAIDALDALEKQLLALFVGKTTLDTLNAVYEIIPSEGVPEQNYVAFRLSPEEGPVGADDLSGAPYYLQFRTEDGSVPQPCPLGYLPSKKRIRCRIPSICNVYLTDGVTVLAKWRLPVYQLGITEDYPITKKPYNR